MPLVLDCSVTVPWYVDDEKTMFTDGLLAQVQRGECWVPGLWRLEFANVLLIAQRRRRIAATRRKQILEQACRLPLRVDFHIPTLQAISEIAERYQLTAYDAAYVELAQRRGLALATLDEDLVRAARAAKLSLATDLSRYPEPEPQKPKKPRV
jgi:predicted nucleic acid-binding protein